MTIFLYAIIFIIGTLLGSFCTLAVYRIPLKKDITHERSFCPNCNHKLSFFDLIPILSYIFLKGKCRYCKQKIRIRYFVLEIVSGLVAVLFALSINMSTSVLEISKYVYFLFGILYIVTIILIAGIDKERKEIQKSVMLFGIICMNAYILYLSIVEKANINRYAIYLFFMLILLCIDIGYLKRKLKTNYTIQILILILLFMMYTTIETVIITIIISLLLIAIGALYKKGNSDKKLPIGFYLCTSNIIMLIVQNFIYFY